MPQRRPDPGRTDAPQPVGVADLAELSGRLGRLRAWSGLSYRELHRRIVRDRTARGVVELPAYNTVYRCLQPGRARLDVELVVDVVRVLTGDPAAVRLWRQCHEAVVCDAGDAAVVAVESGLPDDLGEFVGRAAPLALVRERAADGAGLFTIDGMAGVGKTRLAVRAAHLLHRAGHGRDLRVMVNLRGYDPSRAPAEAGAVLDELLRILGVPAGQVAARDVEGRGERFRQAIRGLCALLILDNAADEGQVRPLLPGGSDCVVLVTSRRCLAGLAGVRIPLDVFGPRESDRLLRRSLGAARVDAEPAAACRLAAAAGHLPLALSLVASRARALPGWTLADHASRLERRRAAGRLDDGVEAALAASYEATEPTGRALLRALSYAGGRDWDAYAAAALTGVPAVEAGRRLAGLAVAHLVSRRGGGRFELHDLVRVYAAARAWDEEPERVQHTTRMALERYYVAAAAHAMYVWAPTDRHRAPAAALDAGELPPFGSEKEALDWLDVERPNLVEVALRSPSPSADHPAVLLAEILPRYLVVRAHYHDAYLLYRCALAHADGGRRAGILSNLAAVKWRLGRPADGLADIRVAIRLAREAGDGRAECGALTNRGIIQTSMGRYEQALADLRRALAVNRRTGDPNRRCRILNNLGFVSVRMGRNAEAVGYFEEARGIAVSLGDNALAGQIIGNIATAWESLGELGRSAECARQALATCRDTGHRCGEADALAALGRLEARRGHLDAAVATLRTALHLAEQIGYRDGVADIAGDLVSAQTRLRGSG